MNFEEFKAIMCDLKNLNYVEVREFKDHCFVKPIKQENDATTNLISSKITEIWENSGIIGDYEKTCGEFVFVKTDDFSECFEEENYEKIAKKIKELDPSFIGAYADGHGIKKYIRLYGHNEYGVKDGRNTRCFENEIYRIIERTLPKDAFFYHKSITTKKGKEWEEKKMNCSEIKICEDFDKILSRY